MSIEVQVWGWRVAGVENRRAHKLSPEESRPVVRAWRKRIFIEQTIVARSQRVMHVDLDAASSQSAHLIEITKAVEKCRSPRISATSSIGSFRKPHRFTGFESVAETRIELFDPVGAR